MVLARIVDLGLYFYGDGWLRCLGLPLWPPGDQIPEIWPLVETFGHQYFVSPPTRFYLLLASYGDLIVLFIQMSFVCVCVFFFSFTWH